MTLSKILSVLGLVAALATAASPLLTPINPKYAAIAAAVAAVATGLGTRLPGAVALPGGPVATGLAILAALMASLLTASAMIPPELGTFLGGLAAAIAAFGRSVFGWGETPK